MCGGRFGELQQVCAGVGASAAAGAGLQQVHEGAGAQIDAGEGTAVQAGGLKASAEVQSGGLEAASPGVPVWRLRVRGRDRTHRNRPAAPRVCISADGGESAFVRVAGFLSGAARRRWADQDFGDNGLVVEGFEEEEEASLREIGGTGGARGGIQEAFDAGFHGVLDEPAR